MDRVVTYYGALARALDPLKTGQNAMVGLAKLAQAVFGTNTCVDGFTLTPTSPASLQANLNPGQIYQLANLESSPISLLAVDTRSILKQGLVLDALPLTFTPPSTPGYAVNVLVQVAYADSDSDPLLLNYYNAANPAQPLQGLGGNGLAQATTRKGVVVVKPLYGIPNTAGTQATPAPEAGFVGLYVVTLAYGMAAITAGNIAQYSGAPFISPKLTEIPAYVQAQIAAATSNSLFSQRALFNTQRVTNNARAALSGAGTLNWVDAMTGLVFTKNRSDTGLLCIAEPGAYVQTAGGAGATYCRLVDSTATYADPKYFACTVNLSGIGAVGMTTTPVFFIPNVPAGTRNWKFQLTRLDGTAWNTIANPDGPDFGGPGSHTGQGSTSTFTFMEIAP